MAKSVIVAVAIAALCFIGVSSEEITLNVYVKKPIAVVSDKFLSITLDPVVLFNGDSLSNDIERSTNMAKALAPAYVRIAGPKSNSYVFERGLYPEDAKDNPGYTFTEKHWTQVHQWADGSGLDVVASIATQQEHQNNEKFKWDPRNALDLISFSDHMGYNGSWQLGYECQALCDNVSGADLGRYVKQLRNMLDAFPRYAENGLLVGPDVVTWKTRQEQQYLMDFFNMASASLSAVTWLPEFAGVTLESDGVSMEQDDLALDKDSLFRVVGRYIYKKPLWLAESKSEECKSQFLGALVWARRLGNAARLGAQVIMRQPDNSNLFKPTPDYWVSVLHKMLVGPEVLDTRVFLGNRSHVHFYGHCTRPSSMYEPGSLTIFGINLTPSKVTVNLRGVKVNLLHKYILLPGFDATNRMFSETVLLNNEPLNLVGGKEVPNLQPAICNSDKGLKLKLPSGGIGFWVLPDLKIKSCMGHDDENPDRNLLKNSAKRIEDFEIEVESEPEEYDLSQETGSEDSIEDGKLSPILRETQKRQLLRRTSRHSRDEIRDQLERRLRPRGRPQAAKRDSDRILRRKEHQILAKNPGKLFVKSNDDGLNSDSEEKLVKSIPRKPKFGTLPPLKPRHHKIQNNQKRHTDEFRRKQQEERTNLKKSHIKSEQDESDEKSMDTGKVIEALTLMTKVENSMKGVEKNNTPADPNDELLDEVLNTEKSKRTAIPTKIEDQIKALYNLLSEKKEKKIDTPAHRQRRDIDGDQMGGMIIRSHSRADDERQSLKDRHKQRFQELKQRIQEIHERRHAKYDRNDSEENNSYGLLPNKPVINFPKGDVYYPPSSGSRDLRKKNKSLRKVKNDVYATVAKDGEWSEERVNDQIPHEFYENLMLPLSESLSSGYYRDVTPKDVKNSMPVEITTEYQKHEDQKIKEKSQEQTKKYSQSNDYQDYKDTAQNQQSEYGPAYETYETATGYEDYQPAMSYQQKPSYRYAHQDPSSQSYQPLYPREKREANNLEDILHWEMIAQDDNNLRDCQCRVIRGVQDCTECQLHDYPQAFGYSYGVVTGPGLPLPNQNYYVNYYDDRMRERRNLKETGALEYQPEITAPSQIQEIRINTQNQQEIQKTTSSKTQNKRVKIKSQEKQEIQKPMTSKSQNEDAVKKSPVAQKIVDSGSSKVQKENATKEHQLAREVPISVPVQVQVEETKVLSFDKQDPQNSTFAKTENKDSQLIPIEKQETREILTSSIPYEEIIASQKTKRQEPQEMILPKEGAGNPAEAKTEQEVALQADEPYSSNVDAYLSTASSSTEDMLNLESQSDKLTASRLPRKIGDPPTKFFLFKDENDPTQIAKRDHKAVTQAKGKSPKSSTPNDSATDTVTNVEARPISRSASTRQASVGLAAVSRNDSNAGAQIPSPRSKSAPEKVTVSSVNDSKDAIVSKLVKSDTKNIFNTKVNSESILTKSEPKSEKSKPRAEPKGNVNSKADSDSQSKFEKKSVTQIVTEPKHSNKSKARINIRTSTEPTITSRISPDSQANSDEKFRNNLEEEKIERVTKKVEPKFTTKQREQMTESSIKSESSVTPKPESETTQNIKKASEGLTTVKPKITTVNPEDQAKVNPARLTLRAEALAALRKENGNKRAKMIETRMKRLENEGARFEKRYKSQLERLKMKLRAKREKMLHDYREELLEVVNENLNEKESSLIRRDVDDKVEDGGSNKKFESVEKVPPIMKNKHVKPIPKQTADKILKKPHRRSISDEASFKHSRKRSLSPEDQFYAADDDHEYQTSSEKRNYDYTDDSNVRRNYRQLPDSHFSQGYVLYEDTNKQDSYQNTKETYQKQQPESHQEDQLKPQNNYSQANDTENYEQQTKQIDDKTDQTKKIQINSNYYKENLENDDFDGDLEDEPDMNLSLDDEIEDDYFERRAYPKSKRSNLRIIEVGPPFYEDEPNYDMQEFYTRPYYQRNYRHYPHEISNRRYRRETLHNRGENLDGPLSFSLSLEKSKMFKKKGRIFEASEESARRKRSANEMYREPNENIKKFYKNSAVTLKKTKKPNKESLKTRNKSSSRQKRSLDETFSPTFISNNEISREDPEMDEILNNIVEMKQDEKLLEEFDHQKSILIDNYRKNQENLNKIFRNSEEIINPTTTEKTESTQTNIETIINDAMPKLETVITGSIKKAQNFSENFEDFIENFDDEEAETTEPPKAKETSNGPSSYVDDGRITSHIFMTVAGKVKKIFDMISRFAQVFQYN